MNVEPCAFRAYGWNVPRNEGVGKLGRCVPCRLRYASDYFPRVGWLTPLSSSSGIRRTLWAPYTKGVMECLDDIMTFQKQCA